jgi:hypothetical protein
VCQGCWEQWGSPAVDTPAVREAARLIGAVYGFGETGGNLHVQLEDWNLEQDLFLDALALPDAEFNVWGGPPEQVAAERACAAAMAALGDDERASALALYEGFWGSPPLTPTGPGLPPADAVAFAAGAATDPAGGGTGLVVVVRDHSAARGFKLLRPGEASGAPYKN